MEHTGEQRHHKSRSKHGESGSETRRESSGAGAVRKSRRRSGERSRSRNRRRSGSSGSQKSPTDDGSSVVKRLVGSNPVPAEPKQNGSSSDKEMRRMSKLDDPLEKNAIREKLRAKPGVRRESGDATRTKGPMVARPPTSPSPVDGSSSASSTPPPPPVSSSSSTSSVRRPRSLLPQRSQSPSSHGKESPFTKQVVNRVASPTSPRLPRHRGYVSPSGSRPGSPNSGHRRAASPNQESLFTLAVGVLKKRVERALHARLFLLTQNGPNSFLIGGDSPDHKYKVTIGSQNCNCGKGPFCVHLLFVMLRVFKVAEDDNLLWNRTLKNYEVELLFAKYEAMKKKKLKHSPSQSSQRSRRSSHSPSTSHLPRPSSPCPSTGSSDQREDEDLCPICLLDMVEGESLVECKNGCHNKLHHHCVAIWEGECQRQQEPMVCPLCRAVWAECPHEDQGAGATSIPHPTTEQGPVEEEEAAGIMESSRLQTFHQKKERWKEAFEDSMVEGMFSRDWGIRENTLHSLSQQLASKLKHGRVNEPHDVDTCEECFQADSITMESGFHMVAMACSDPVYKVYVAALRVLRTLLMCSHCSTEDQQVQLRSWLQPVMSAILVKSADGNRRTAQLSVSAMFELARGDSGELAVSKELSCSSCIGLGSLDYILSCLISDIQINMDESSWQHILGCLCVLERVFADFPEQFNITDNNSEAEKESKIECLVSIATCVSAYLNNSHTRICKIAKKTSVIVAKILVADEPGFARICDMMRTLESREVGSRMLRRLQKILNDYEGALDAAREREDAALHGGDEDDDKDGRRNGMLSSHRDTSHPCAAENTPPSSRRDSDTRTSSRPSLRDSAEGCFQKRSPVVNYNGQTNVSDLSDLSASPTTPCDNPISFKSEVASSPKKRLAAFDFTLPGAGSKNCKDEVEAEEAEALAVAMEASMHTQGVLPCVPGLRTENKGDVIIKIDHKKSPSEEVDGYVSPRSKQYMECQDWTKGAILGTGAFSSCYMARDVKTGTLMAVKQISFCRNNDKEQDETREEIVKEIKLMSTFDHPHIVRLMGATQHDAHFNVFVEWMPGGAVNTLLKDFGAFSNAVTVKYIHQVCLGLAYLHDNRVIHRDLKGANLLMDSTGHHLRIADLGTAAKMNADITRTDEFKGQFLGTISFMAPEVLRGEPYGRSCDIWSVGCCIIEMCTTKPPWNDNAISNHYQLLFKIASANGPPPIPETLSPALRDIALRCLESTPSARPGILELLKHPAFTQMKK